MDRTVWLVHIQVWPRTESTTRTVYVVTYIRTGDEVQTQVGNVRISKYELDAPTALDRVHISSSSRDTMAPQYTHALETRSGRTENQHKLAGTPQILRF